MLFRFSCDICCSGTLLSICVTALLLCFCVKKADAVLLLSSEFFVVFILFSIFFNSYLSRLMSVGVSFSSLRSM